ncbi:MAG TPA: ribosome maturation factor RimM [Candidatus Tumulicola sp.]
MALIAGPFGVRGELKCDPTPAGRTLVLAGAEFRCDFSQTPIATAGAVPAESVIRLAAVRPHKGRLLVRVDGVDDANAAEGYRGATLYAARDRVEVAPGEYLDGDLVGCEVFDAGGHRYGAVDSVAHYPASDMLVVAGVMVPMVSEFIRAIDVGERRIVIAPPAGLFD